MADTPPTPGTPPAVPQADAAAPDAQLVDGVALPRQSPLRTSAVGTATGASPVAVSRWKHVILFLVGSVYLLYVLWCGALLILLPSTDPSLKNLPPLGTLSALIGAAVFVAIGLLLFLRVTRSSAPIAVRQRSLVKIGIFLLPGLALSGLVPVMITREPPLSLEIVSPTRSEDFVAPLIVSFSAEKAVSTLRQLGYRPIQFAWDTDGNGTVNDKTVVPTETAIYDRQGSYVVSVTITLDNGTARTITRRVTIPTAVFSVTPAQPIVAKPVRFSIENLLTDPKQLVEVDWDFDGDGKTDETSKNVDILHTFYATGRAVVIATLQLQNKTQATLQRTISIEEPPPLPFPVVLRAEPKNLVGPVPFGTIFHLDTAEPLQDVQWNYGDGKTDEGANLKRVAHSFESPGIYSVTAKVRNGSGKIAELTSLVHATEILSLPDLHFDGNPDVTGNAIHGEVPLTVQITPVTSVPLIQFSWEDADQSQPIAGATYQNVYRKEGSYHITLIAQNPESKAMRMPLTITVNPPSPELSIQMSPDGGVAPLDVTFDASNTFIPPGDQIAGFKWLYGDESPQAQAELGASRVEHTYAKPGEYTVTLTVVMASGKPYSAQKTLVVRRPSLSACLTSSRVKIQAGEGIAFDASCSTGSPSSMLWDVRYDAQPDTVLAQSNDAKYDHVFDTPGAYTVTLTVKDAFGNADKQSVSITVTPALNSSSSSVSPFSP
ncbi:PKD domain-containing protein [Candidatus Peregrinibacteria bacterium]|nr:PKD domain-containing protein [Candidatus Peregrinibacteria bacterium]MBI3816221.1 PKD domain-containing protein [Candidatus Peregrinibacteria bacterium]